MKKKKFLILAITISFPVLLYLFLRFFGQNSYDLPVFFGKVGENCNEKITFNSSGLGNAFHSGKEVKSLLTANYNLLIFPDTQRDITPYKNELARVVQELTDKIELRIISFSSGDSLFTDEISLRNYTITNYHILATDYNQLLNCELKVPNDSFEGIHPTEEIWPSNEVIVLVDEKLSIRGYYNGFETKEVDRLILELNVLLSKN